MFRAAMQTDTFQKYLAAHRVRLFALLPVLVYLTALACLAANAFALMGFPLDDAWIHGVYARSFAWGHGLQYNPGQQEAGSTSPLWAMVSAPAHWLIGLGTTAVVLGVKFIGVLLGLVCLRAITCIGRKISGSAVAGCIAACLFALDPRFLFSSMSGMENTLLLALWLGGGAALLTERPLLSAVLFGLTPVTRPEAILALPLALPGLVLFSRRRNWRPAMFAAWVLPGIPLLLWVLFCHSATGHLLPNTYYLKAHPFHLGLAELAVTGEVIRANSLLPPLALFFGSAALLATCIRLQQPFRMGAVVLTLVGVPLAYLCGVAGTRHLLAEGYYWTRWMDPASLLLTVAACVGFGILLAPETTPALLPATAGRMRRLAPRLCAAAVLLVSIPCFVDSFADRRYHLALDSRAIYLINVRAGKWIREHVPADAVIAVNDAGAIRFFGQRKTIDLVGLNYAPIAFRRVSREQIIREVDWLAVFKKWVQNYALWPQISTSFEPRVSFSIPLEEYTICNCPDQTNTIVLARRPAASSQQP